MGHSASGAHFKMSVSQKRQIRPCTHSPSCGPCSHAAAHAICYICGRKLRDVGVRTVTTHHNTTASRRWCRPSCTRSRPYGAAGCCSCTPPPGWSARPHGSGCRRSVHDYFSDLPRSSTVCGAMPPRPATTWSRFIFTPGLLVSLQAAANTACSRLASSVNACVVTATAALYLWHARDALAPDAPPVAPLAQFSIQVRAQAWVAPLASRGRSPRPLPYRSVLAPLGSFFGPRTGNDRLPGDGPGDKHCGRV